MLVGLYKYGILWKVIYKQEDFYLTIFDGAGSFCLGSTMDKKVYRIRKAWCVNSDVSRDGQDSMRKEIELFNLGNPISPACLQLILNLKIV